MCVFAKSIKQSKNMNKVFKTPNLRVEITYFLAFSVLFFTNPVYAYTADKPKETGVIEYIRPISVAVFNTKKYKDRVIKFADGYNPMVWDYDEITDQHKGFSVAKMKQTKKYFPTTGFYGAEFDLIGTDDDQSIYRCTTKSSWIELSSQSDKNLGQNCHVTFISETKPTSTAVIIMEQRINGNWIKVDSYKIQIPKKWAIVSNRVKEYADEYLDENPTNFPALDYCRKVGPRADRGKTTWQQGAGQNPEDRAFRQKYMYRRNELTNSVFADPIKYPEGRVSSSQRDFFSRDIDTTFTGEWGILFSYVKSGFRITGNSNHITAEAYSASNQANVYDFGSVNPGDRDYSYVVVCRGE